MRRARSGARTRCHVRFRDKRVVGARTPEGGERSFPGGVVHCEHWTEVVFRRHRWLDDREDRPRRGAMRRGTVGTRRIPVSPRFLVDVARSPTPFVACQECRLETLLTLIVARLFGRRTLVFQGHVGRSGERLLVRRYPNIVVGSVDSATRVRSEHARRQRRDRPAAPSRPRPSVSDHDSCAARTEQSCASSAWTSVSRERGRCS